MSLKFNKLFVQSMSHTSNRVKIKNKINITSFITKSIINTEFHIAEHSIKTNYDYLSLGNLMDIRNVIIDKIPIVLCKFSGSFIIGQFLCCYFHNNYVLFPITVVTLQYGIDVLKNDQLLQITESMIFNKNLESENDTLKNKNT